MNHRYSTLLKNSRKKKGLTQQQLADKVGVSQSRISAMESKGEIPDDIKNHVIEILGLSLDSFIGSEEDIALWTDYITSLVEEHEFDAPGGESYPEYELETNGIYIFLEPLIDAGFELPKPPVKISDDPELTVDEQYRFNSDTDMEIFHTVFYNVISSYHYSQFNLDTIQNKGQIADRDYDRLRESMGFCWARGLYEYYQENGVHLLPEQPTTLLGYSIEAYETAVIQAWLTAYRGGDGQETVSSPPNWRVIDLLTPVEADPGEICLSAADYILQGESPDPFIRNIKFRTELQDIAIEEANNKLDKIMKHLGIE